MKRKVFHEKRNELVESRRETRAEKTGISAFIEYVEFLHETISRLERENSEGRTRINELQAEVASLRPYLPTSIAQEILLRFCRADTTELRETAIIAMCPENTLAVQAALSELSDHNLLAVDQTRNDTFYVVTTKGQDLCFSCRR